MQFDSIPFDRMRPDSSLYEKGLLCVVNAVPYDANSWREINSPQQVADVGLTTDWDVAGTYSESTGTIWAGVTASAVPASRIYEFSAGALTNRTPGTDYAGAPARFRFANFGTSVIAAPENVNVGAAVQLQVRSGAGNFANLVTSVDRPAPKFIGVSKSHVVGAHNLGFGGAGVYAAANPYQVMWCARNDAAEWTPGTDRSGFLQVRDARGEITGISCFTEFFLVFQQYGVTRYSWLGGDTVWEAQEIAGVEFGIRSAAQEPAIVPGNRNSYYLSNSGPAVVVNGEAVQGLGEGEWRRFFYDGSPDANLDFAIDFSARVTGGYEPESRNLVWCARRLLDGQFFQIMFRPTDGRVSAGIFNGSLGTTEVAFVRGGFQTYPLDSLHLFRMEDTALTVSRLGGGTRQTLVPEFYSKRWRPATGKRGSLLGVRPLLVLRDYATEPPVQVAVSTITKPSEPPSAPVSLAVETNGNGWNDISPLPIEANEYLFKVSLPALADSSSIGEFPALELAFTESSVF